jgi:hippurate hydrolase
MADLRGKLDEPGHTIILRGDMDALPLQEDTDLPFRSRIAGRMHACGHDSHTAMLVGAARLLARHQADFAGTVRFMFQPGEEGFAGAKVMLREGLLEAPEGGSPPRAAFALHASPRNAAGSINTRPGPSAASADTFEIVVRGRGGHASAPHLAADPVPVACEIVTAIQTMVTRSINIFSPGVVTVGKIEAGTTHNIIPEVATLVGTIRTLSESTRNQIQEALHRLAHGVASAHGLDADVNVSDGYPVTVNDTEFAHFVLGVARDTLGAESAVESPFPLMAAEDFSYVLQEVPGAMASLGTLPDGYALGEAPNNHSNRVLLNEEAMAAGVAMHAAVALTFLRR